MTDPMTLARRIEDGDIDAAKTLLEMQRAGRGLRLYPHGRKGPLDNGLSPLVLTYDEDLVGLRWEVPFSGPFMLPVDQVGRIARMVIRSVARTLADALESGPSEPYRRTQAFAWLMADGNAIGLLFVPYDRPSEWVLGFGKLLTLLAAMGDAIQQAGWTADQIGVEPLEWSSLMQASDTLNRKDDDDEAP